MNKSVSIYNALCLPSPDVKALIEGRMICVIPRKLFNVGKTFALYPVDISTVEIEEYYRHIYLLPEHYREKDNTNKVLIKAWAKCELCEIPDQTKQLDILSQLTIWKPELFEEILQNRPHFFLAYLRVYHLDKPLEIPTIPNIQEKLGKFAPLPNHISVSETKPVLSDYIFNQRKQQLEDRQPPLHPELEELQTSLLPIANNNPAAQQLEQEIRVFLGWSNKPCKNNLDPDLAWIRNIAKVGNSSDGNEFERLVRKSLIKLGFYCSNTNPKANLDPDKLGGAGGVDFYCEYPYQVVGECKATKTEKIPSKTPGQLIQLGKNHVQEKYDSCLKLIVAAGELTNDALLTTVNNGIYMIRPETLQNLVELQTKYKNSVNLIELKEYLQKGKYGLVDDKINEYIEKVEQEIKLRSHIIQLVKNYLQNARIESTGVDTLHGAYFGSQPPQPLTPEEMYEILIELSSPLTGYLGKQKGQDWKTDKFYYLRDLPIN